MSLKHAILGFLSHKSFSGYGLKKTFDGSVQHFWPANQSQIYRELAILHEGGLVEQEVIKRTDRLDKKVYSITDKGREWLHDWLSTPLPSQDFREPFLIQVYFGGLLTDQELLFLLETEIRAINERLAVFQEMYSGFNDSLEQQPNNKAYFMSILTMEYGLLADKFALDWVTSVRDRLAEKNYSLHDIQVKD